MTFDKYLPNLNNCISTANFPGETVIGFAGQVPILINLENTNGLCYQVNDKNRNEVESYIEEIVLSIIARTLSNLYEITIIDLTLNERSKNITQLSTVFKNINVIRKQDEVLSTLETMWDKAIKVNDTKLLYSKNLIEYNKNAIENNTKTEPYKFLVIYDIPTDFDNKSIDILLKLMNQASKTGIHIIMTFDLKSQNLNDERNFKLHEALKAIIRNSIFIGIDRNNIYQIKGLPHTLDLLYSKLITKQSIHFNKQPFCFEGTTEQMISSIIESNENEPKNTRKNRIQVKIGIDENGSDTFFCFGETAAAYHGIIFGNTGMGKSALLNKIIYEIGKKYTSNEIRLYLIDFSNVSFKFHKNNPNLEQLIENRNQNNIIKAVELLESLDSEYSYRTNTLNISNIDDYNENALTNGTVQIPNILVIIDEAHHFYDTKIKVKLTREELSQLSPEEKAKYNDTPIKDRINEVFDVFTRDYRKVGIHLLLATQHIQRMGIDPNITDNMLLRIGFKVTQWDKAAIFFPNSKHDLPTLSSLEAFYTISGDSKSKKGEINTIKCYIQPPNYKNEEYLNAYN